MIVTEFAGVQRVEHPKPRKVKRVLYDVVVVKPDPMKEMTDSGLIYIPEQYRNRAWTGKVVMIGNGFRPGYKRKEFQRGDETWLKDSKWQGNVIPLDVKVGDRVLVALEQIVEMYDTEELLWFTRQEKILAVLEDE